MPTGVTQPIDRFFANPAAVPLAPLELDDVFSDLVRDARGQATMSVRGKTQRLEVVLGANYRAVVIYAPKPAPGQDAASRNFVCIEPVAGIINALNLAHKGVYKELQSIPPAVSGRRVSGFAQAVSSHVTSPCFRAFRWIAGEHLSHAQLRREITFDDIARPKPGEWPSYNGHLSANRHSPLDRINTRNVAMLEPKWTHEMGGKRALQMTPLVIDGVMYVAAVNEARALDARTGRQIWQFAARRRRDSFQRETRRPASTAPSPCSAIACFFRPITRTCWRSIDRPDSFSGTSRWRTIA